MKNDRVKIEVMNDAGVVTLCLGVWELIALAERSKVINEIPPGRWFARVSALDNAMVFDVEAPGADLY